MEQFANQKHLQLLAQVSKITLHTLGELPVLLRFKVARKIL